MNLKKIDIYESLGIYGRTILEWILKEIGNNRRIWVDSAQDRDFGEPCESGIELLGSLSHGVSIVLVVVGGGIIHLAIR